MKTEHLTHFIAVKLYYWGKGATRDEALKNMQKAAETRAKPKDYILYQVEADAYIDDYGNLCYKNFGDDHAPYLEVENTLPKRKRA